MKHQNDPHVCTDELKIIYSNLMMKALQIRQVFVKSLSEKMQGSDSFTTFLAKMKQSVAIDGQTEDQLLGLTTTNGNNAVKLQMLCNRLMPAVESFRLQSNPSFDNFISYTNTQDHLCKA